MVDLVGTCPKGFWLEWLDEGDIAGSPYTGETWSWFTRDRKAELIKPGDRFYVVAWDKLRGYAPVVEVRKTGDGGYAICRRGDAVACTISTAIPGFRGLRQPFWDRAAEVPFPTWKTDGIPAGLSL